MLAASDFNLSDHRGGRFRLMEHLPAAGTVLVFYRGHWCPYCRRYLTKLQAHYSEFVKRNVSLVAISPEPPSTSAALARDLELSFTLLSDTAGTVIDHYGVRNGFSSVRTLLPHPAVVILDAQANIYFSRIDRNIQKRTTIRTILHVLDELQTQTPAQMSALA